jgi:hypothetical protein
MENINSGADYAQVIIDSIMKTEKELSEEQQSPIELLECWTEHIQNKADETYLDYIIGKRESYMFTEEEFIDLQRKAMEDYTQILLNKMVDKGLLEVSVGDDGDFLYGLSEDGEKLSKDLFGDIKKNNNETLR